MVSRNCGAFNSGKDLIRAELFGADKGAYSGCDRPRTGAVEEANGGTLFLDEIAELPAELQKMLLRFLDRWTRPLTPPLATALTERAGRERITAAIKQSVKATTHHADARAVAEASRGLGQAMRGLDVATLSPADRLQGRGW